MTDRVALEAFTGRFDPYSDFCFSTLWFYNSNEQTRWCWLHGNLVLLLNDGFGSGAYLIFLGENHAAAHALIEYAGQNGLSPTLQRVPEVSAQAVLRGNGSLLVSEDRNGFDYVHCTKSLVQLDNAAHSKTPPRCAPVCKSPSPPSPAAARP